jgi:hypothetical protein
MAKEEELYGNSNISPFKNIYNLRKTTTKSSERNQNPFKIL